MRRLDKFYSICRATRRAPRRSVSDIRFLYCDIGLGQQFVSSFDAGKHKISRKIVINNESVWDLVLKLSHNNYNFFEFINRKTSKLSLHIWMPMRNLFLYGFIWKRLFGLLKKSGLYEIFLKWNCRSWMREKWELLWS